MSWGPAAEPECLGHPAGAVELVIEARSSEVGGVPVRRLLPSRRRRMVGPFIFLDHMGPAFFAPGRGIDVPPHPHIHLATVTYLFAGELVHRDSLGCVQPIRPGDVNWMHAGRGIVHSERTPPELRSRTSALHGLQLWVALPRAEEETPPRFAHYPGAELPGWTAPGVTARILAGTAYGATSPVRTSSPTLYVDAVLAAGARLPLPEAEERCVYVAEGAVSLAGESFAASQLVVLRPGAVPALVAESAARVVVLGGAPIDGERYIWWNFVSSSRERIERAKQDWREERFPVIPGDDIERVPLPE